jgi:hypothetical protein
MEMPLTASTVVPELTSVARKDETAQLVSQEKEHSVIDDTSLSGQPFPVSRFFVYPRVDGNSQSRTPHKEVYPQYPILCFIV